MSALVTTEITLSPRWQIFPVAICRLSDNKFKCLYLKKERLFFGFFIEFLKCARNLEHSEEKEEYPSLIITEIIAFERDGLLKRLKGLGSETPC